MIKYLLQLKLETWNFRGILGHPNFIVVFLFLFSAHFTPGIINIVLFSVFTLNRCEWNDTASRPELSVVQHLQWVELDFIGQASHHWSVFGISESGLEMVLSSAHLWICLSLFCTQFLHILLHTKFKVREKNSFNLIIFLVVYRLNKNIYISSIR